MGAPGFESSLQTLKNGAKTDISETLVQKAAQSTPDKAGQTHPAETESTEIDPDLQRIIAVWPELTEDDRRAIVADVMSRLDAKGSPR
jgi:hypothetical protein